MMHISEELVRELQKRIDISYEEAEYYLKRTKGDINMAVFLIMKKRNSSWERFKASLWELMKYRFILTRKGEIIVNLPLLLLALFILLYGIERHIFPLIVIFIVILVTECEVRIEKLEWEESSNKKRNHHSGKKSTVYESNKFYDDENQPKKHKQDYKQNINPDLKQQVKQDHMTNVNYENNQFDKDKQDTNSDINQEKTVSKTIVGNEPSKKVSNNMNEAEDDYYEIVIEE